MALNVYISEESDFLRTFGTSNKHFRDLNLALVPSIIIPCEILKLHHSDGTNIQKFEGFTLSFTLKIKGLNHEINWI